MLPTNLLQGLTTNFCHWKDWLRQKEKYTCTITSKMHEIGNYTTTLWKSAVPLLCLCLYLLVPGIENCDNDQHERSPRLITNDSAESALITVVLPLSAAKDLLQSISFLPRLVVILYSSKGAEPSQLLHMKKNIFCMMNFYWCSWT